MDDRDTGIGTVTIGALSRDASGVVDDVVKSRRPALVTRDGRPVAALVPVDPEHLEDFVLAVAPELAESRVEADDELAQGATRSLEAVLADLGVQR